MRHQDGSRSAARQVGAEPERSAVSIKRATSRTTPRRGPACARPAVTLNRNGHRRIIRDDIWEGFRGRPRDCGPCPLATRVHPQSGYDRGAVRDVLPGEGSAAARVAQTARMKRRIDSPDGARAVQCHALGRSSRCLAISVTTRDSRDSRSVAGRKSMDSGSSSVSSTTSRSSPAPDMRRSRETTPSDFHTAIARQDPSADSYHRRVLERTTTRPRLAQNGVFLQPERTLQLTSEL